MTCCFKTVIVVSLVILFGFCLITLYPKFREEFLSLNYEVDEWLRENQLKHYRELFRRQEMWGEESEICSIGMTMHPSASASSGISQLAQCADADSLPELPAPEEERVRRAASALRQRLVLRQWLSAHQLRGHFAKLLAADVAALEDVYWLEDNKAKQVFNKDFPKWSTARQALPISKHHLDVLKADLWSEVVKSSNHQDAWTWGVIHVLVIAKKDMRREDSERL